MKILLSAAIAMLFSGVCLGQSIYFVDSAAQGQNNGTSWADAFISLHSALYSAQSGDEVWVASGIYRPTTGTDRTIHFEQKSGIKLFGGFAGTESFLSERKLNEFPTIIDGDIGTQGDISDNSFTLLYMKAAAEGTVIDGIQFQQGNAGTLSSPLYNQETCGGAIYIEVGDEQIFPIISNCTFLNNRASKRGGAIYLVAGLNGNVAPRFWDCAFEYNLAAEGDGGAIFINGGNNLEQQGDFVRCRFYANQSEGYGGAVYFGEGARSDTIEILNSRFEKNFSMSFGGGFFTSGRLNGTKTRVHGTHFVENFARFGAGYCHYSDLNLIKWILFDSCSFVKNQFYTPSPTASKFGSALDIYAGGYNPNSLESKNLILQNSTFFDQEASSVEIILFHGDIHVTGNNFTKTNSMFYSTLDSIILEKNIIEYCDTPLKVTDGSHNFIVNNIFLANSAFNGLIGAKSALIIGNAFVNNTISNPGTQSSSYPFPSYFENNIFWGNINTSQPDSLVWQIPYANSYAIFSNNLFDFSSCDSLPGKFVCGSGNKFLAVPQFVDWSNDDFRLMPCSPAINAGINQPYEQINIETDLLGKNRINDGLVDIGPIESEGLLLLTAPLVRPSCPSGSGGAVLFEIENGCAPFEFHWSGSNGEGSDTINLLAGNYSFTITDNNEKTILKQIEVSLSPVPQIEETIENASCPTCPDGSIALNIENGNNSYSYYWINGQTESIISGLLPGTYTVTLTDAADCSFVISYSLSSKVAAQEPDQSKFFSINPNPSDDALFLEANTTVSRFEIYDFLGRLLKASDIPPIVGNQKIQIDLGGLSKGQYLIVCSGKEGEIFGRATFQKH